MIKQRNVSNLEALLHSFIESLTLKNIYIYIWPVIQYELKINHFHI